MSSSPLHLLRAAQNSSQGIQQPSCPMDFLSTSSTFRDLGELLSSEPAVLSQPKVPEHAGEGKLPAAVPGVSRCLQLHCCLRLLDTTAPRGHMPLGPHLFRSMKIQDLLPQSSAQIPACPQPRRSCPCPTFPTHRQPSGLAGSFGSAASAARERLPRLGKAQRA